jgi:hypothetical protein
LYYILPSSQNGRRPGIPEVQVLIVKKGKRQASLTPYSPNVIDLEGVYHLGETLAIRVRLKNLRQ